MQIETRLPRSVSIWFLLYTYSKICSEENEKTRKRGRDAWERLRKERWKLVEWKKRFFSFRFVVSFSFPDFPGKKKRTRDLCSSPPSRRHKNISFPFEFQRTNKFIIVKKKNVTNKTALQLWIECMHHLSRPCFFQTRYDVGEGIKWEYPFKNIKWVICNNVLLNCKHRLDLN